MNKKELAAKFHHDVENICKELIDAFSLKFKQEVPNLSSPLCRWLDFRYRYIDPQPRKVVFSDRFPKKRLPDTAQRGLKKMIRAIKLGKDINPYQGRGLTLRNDFSGDKKNTRTDLLWADWDIHHLHLSPFPIPKDQYFSKPADYLAFCIIGGDLVVMIDVLRHPDNEGFANPDLIKTVERNWPDYMAQFQMKGVMGEKELNQQEIHQFRSIGLNAPLTIEGDVFMGPGLGLTSAATPLKITMAEGRIQRTLQSLAELVCDPEGQFRNSTVNQLGNKADYSIVPTPNGLCVYESMSRCAYLLPSTSIAESSSELADIHDLIMPGWARAQLLSKAGVDIVHADDN